MLRNHKCTSPEKNYNYNNNSQSNLVIGSISVKWGFPTHKSPLPVGDPNPDCDADPEIKSTGGGLCCLRPSICFVVIIITGIIIIIIINTSKHNQLHKL